MKRSKTKDINLTVFKEMLTFLSQMAKYKSLICKFWKETSYMLQALPTTDQ